MLLQHCILILCYVQDFARCMTMHDALCKAPPLAISLLTLFHVCPRCCCGCPSQLVRKVNGRTQLVLLDHGLYRQIDDAFREQYAGLWRALVFADKHGIKKHSEEMNAGEAYPLFAAMLTHKPWDQITDLHLDHLSLEGSKEEREMLQKNAQVRGFEHVFLAKRAVAWVGVGLWEVRTREKLGRQQ